MILSSSTTADHTTKLLYLHEQGMHLSVGMFTIFKKFTVVDATMIVNLMFLILLDEALGSPKAQQHDSDDSPSTSTHSSGLAQQHHQQQQTSGGSGSGHGPLKRKQRRYR